MKSNFSLDNSGNRGHDGPMPRQKAVSSEAARTVHLVDIENLLGTAEFDERDVQIVMSSYSATAGRRQGDHLIVGSSHHSACATWFGCPDARRLVRSGPDGADLALLEAAECEGLAQRFDRVVIGSGDGLFAALAAELQAAGCAVTVVTCRDSLSSRLRLAVQDIRYLDELDPIPASAIERRSA